MIPKSILAVQPDQGQQSLNERQELRYFQGLRRRCRDNVSETIDETSERMILSDEAAKDSNTSGI